MEMLFKAKFTYENVPEFIQPLIADLFMKTRNMAVKVFNEHIDEVNAEWNLTGEKASFGKFIEDINPKYEKLLIDRIQPYIDERINKRNKVVEVYIGEYGDLYGRVKAFKGSKITLSLFPVEN